MDEVVKCCLQALVIFVVGMTAILCLKHPPEG